MSAEGAIGSAGGGRSQEALRVLCGSGVVALPVLLLIGQAAADIAISLIAVLFIARSFLSGGWRWLEEPWVLVGLGLWVYLMLNAAHVAADQAAANARAAPFGRFVVFAAALQFWLLTDRAVVRRLVVVLAATLAFVAADCLLQYATGSDLFGRSAERFRLTGPFSDPVPGTFLAHLCFPVVAVAWSAAGGSRSRLALAIAGTVGLGLAIALTGERTALLMYGFGLVLLALLLPVARRPLLLTGLVAAVLVGAAIAAQPKLQERLVGHTTHDLTRFWERRVGELLLRGQEVWWENPLLGIGLSNFRDVCGRDDYEPRGPVEERCYTHPHHIWNEWLAETGLIGFSGFLLLCLLIGRAVGRGLRRARRHDALLLGLTIALVIMLWPLRPSMSFFGNWFAAILWLTIGWALAIAAPHGCASSSPRPCPPASAASRIGSPRGLYSSTNGRMLHRPKAVGEPP